MRPCFAFIAVEQNDVARCGLLLQKVQAQTVSSTSAATWRPLSRRVSPTISTTKVSP
jgi:hypothetical protein